MMDKAFWGYIRWGHFRWGVYRDDWDRLLKTFKDVPAKTAGGITPAIQGTARQGQTRQGVYVPFFDEMKEQFKKVV